jgi:hypothetical protein
MLWLVFESTILQNSGYGHQPGAGIGGYATGRDMRKSWRNTEGSTAATPKMNGTILPTFM